MFVTSRDVHWAPRRALTGMALSLANVITLLMKRPGPLCTAKMAAKTWTTMALTCALLEACTELVREQF
jgi:hypothetical protein